MTDHRARMARIRALQDGVLPALIARAGGTVTITPAEVDALATRYGGYGRFTMRTEALISSDGEALRVTLLETDEPTGPVA
jgi:hypothetical protein